MIRKIVILVFVFVLYAFISQSSAQLLMERSRIDIKANPGDTIIDSMNLHNTSDEPIRVKAYWEDFEYIAPYDGKKKFVPAGTSKYSIANYLSFSPKEFLLQPKSKQKINFTIQLPSNLKGGFYGVLFFEKVGEQKIDQTGVSIITRLGSLFYVELSNKSKKAIVSNITSDKSLLKGNIENHGDVFLFPKGIYYILDSNDLVSERNELKGVYLPPGAKKDFEINIPANLNDGKNILVLTFDLKDGDSVVKEIEFEKHGSKLQIIDTRD